MPYRAPSIRICGCVLSSGQSCEHSIARDRERKARFDALRPSARQRGYTSKWEKESKAFLSLSQNQRCACGCGRAADMIDHITPHRGDQRLFWDRRNWQAMAAVPCHVSKKQRLERRVEVRKRTIPSEVSER